MNKLKNFAHAIFIKSEFLQDLAIFIIVASAITLSGSLLGLIVTLIFPPFPFKPETPYFIRLFATGMIFLFTLSVPIAISAWVYKFCKFVKKSWRNS